MSSRRTYRVAEVARLSGVSVRALHHYDAIGLLKPAARSGAGYRLYTEQDLLRLQQVLLGRELGLSLEEIKRSFEAPDYDPRQALLRHREVLTRRAEDTARMLRAVDQALTSLGAPSELAKDEAKGEDEMALRDLFDGFDPSQYEDEVEERWGETEAYRESLRRTQRYSAEDWKRLKEEQNAIYTAAAELHARGVAPTSAEARAVAEQHRASIERWFYPCDTTMHTGLAELYENDARFAANIDRFGAGLTEFLVAAIRATAGVS
jgi:DNA-binding transcriptional MerR regulator